MLIRTEKPSLIRRIASEFSGIGWERARAVEKHFGTLRKMFEAEESEWREVEGIGKLTAKKCWTVLHEN
jgi:ERCC4-type nuclease